MVEIGFTEKIHQITKLAVVVDALAEWGIAADKALRDTGVSPEELHLPTKLISLNQVMTGYRNAMRLSPDLDLPFRIGSSVHVSAYGMYGYAILCSMVFRETMNFALKYHALAVPVCAISFDEKNGQGVWTIEPIHHSSIGPKLYRFIVELQLGIHISLHRDIMGSSFKPSEISLTYGPCEDFRLTPELVGCPLRFNRPANRITFDSKWLDQTPKLGARVTYASLVALCDELLADIASRVGSAGRVRSILLEDIANRPSFEAIAKLLGTTPRTLRRQLQKQGTSYRDLVDELRVQIAIKYLAETNMTNEDIAFALGFSDAANFRHAFRRWTQRAPGAIRRNWNDDTAQ
jgi:AraC-like DNA-binding protein